MPTYYVLQYHVALASGMVYRMMCRLLGSSASPLELSSLSISPRIDISSVVLRTPYEDWIKIRGYYGTHDVLLFHSHILEERNGTVEFSSVLTRIFLPAEQFKPQAV